MEYLYVVCVVWCSVCAWCCVVRVFAVGWGVLCVCVCVMECVGMRAVCVGGVVVGGRERRKCVVAQRDQSVIKKTKRSVR